VLTCAFVIRLGPRPGGPLGLANFGRCKFFVGCTSSYKNFSTNSDPNSISSFFDYNGGSDGLDALTAPRPKMTFQARDPDTPIETGTNFSRNYCIMNNGDTPWPLNCSLDFIGGEMYSGPKEIPIPSLKPGDTMNISLHLRAPFQPGSHAGSWMMCAKGDFSFMFGEVIWVVTNVLGTSNTTPFNTTPFNFQPQQHTSVNVDMDMGMGMGDGFNPYAFGGDFVQHNTSTQTDVNSGYQFGQIKPMNNSSGGNSSNTVNNPFRF